METVMVRLGDKNYRAEPMTVDQTVLASRTLAGLGKGLAADGDEAFAAIADSIETFAEILLSALRKVNPEFIALEVQRARPDEIITALGTLIPFSVNPAALSTLSGQLLSSFGRYKGEN